MRVAVLVRHFPNLTQTFVLDQITALLARGCHVDIFAERPLAVDAVHPAVSAHQLDGCTTYYHIPDAYFRRVLEGVNVWWGRGGDSPALRWRPLNVRRYGIEAASLRLLFETAACMDHAPYDVIHCHFGPTGLLGARLRHLGALRGRLVTTFYGYDLWRRRYDRRSYAFLFREGDLFLAISERMRRRLIELGCEERKIAIHRLGVDLERFTPTRRTEGGGSAHVVTIARFVPKKGLEIGLHALASLVGRYPDVRYTVIGDGPLRPRLERLVRSLGLDGVVQLVGWQPRPRLIDIVHGADILLLPSVTADDGDSEGTPVALLEAMAAGLPVVTTRHGSIPEMVSDGVSGFLVAERDVDGLTTAMQRLLEAPALRARMGRAGRDFVQAQHDTNVLNGRLLDLYRMMVAG